MSGFATIAAAWLAAMTLIPALLLFTAAGSLLVELQKSTIESAEIALRQNHYKILNITVVQPHLIQFYVENEGPYAHRAANFRYVDVIITYVRKTDGALRSVWLSYDPGRAKPEGWRIIAVYTNGFAGELLDHIDLVDGYSGIWNVRETIEVEAWLDDLIDGQYPVLVRFVGAEWVGG
ncbi:MAG: hypothetical protein NXY59_01370 [Aigarchaeota archaeon]|nr:hypothetical protein [Candidatus Pelearchaeum maunauluense]